MQNKIVNIIVIMAPKTSLNFPYLRKSKIIFFGRELASVQDVQLFP